MIPNTFGKFKSGNYRYVKKIGYGTYGEAILVKKIPTNELHIVKRIPYDREITHDILKEIDTLRRFQGYPNIASFVDVKLHSTNIQILMKYHGKTLSKFIQTNSTKNRLKYAKGIFSQILSGLHWLHSKNVIHRDIKPDNILIIKEDSLLNPNNTGTSTGGNFGYTVTICDFGLSKIRILPKNTPKVCSLNYRAPELLLEREDYTETIDIWAFGCVLYEYLTQKVLFEEQRTKRDLLNAILDPSFLKNKLNLLPDDTTPTTITLKTKDHNNIHNIYPKYDMILQENILRIKPNSRNSASELMTKLFGLVIPVLPVTCAVTCGKLTDSKFSEINMVNDKLDYISVYCRNSNGKLDFDQSLVHRTQLFKWMYHIAQKNSLFDETVYLSYELVDRFMSSNSANTNSMIIPTTKEFEYICLACLRIASKFFEITSIQFSFLKDKQLCKINECEKMVLTTLKWIIYTPSYYELLVHNIPNDIDRRKKLTWYMYKNYNISKQSQNNIKNKLETIFSFN
jgi:serine/threonine protein kinase